MTRVATVDCMDPRRTIPAEVGATDRLKLRTAGGFVGGVKREMPELFRRFDVREVRSRLHEDCGAIKVVAAEIKHPGSISAAFHNFVEPFKRFVNIPDTELLQDVGKLLQYSAASKFMRNPHGISCTVEPNVGSVTGERVLLLMAPTIGKFTDVMKPLNLSPESTYVLTLVPGQVSTMATDVQLAVSHVGIKRIVAFTGADRAKAVETFYRAMRRGEVQVPISQNRVEIHHKLG